VGEFATPAIRPRIPRCPRRSKGVPVLYFTYTSRLAPELIADVAPEAEFKFIAHIPEHGVRFPINADGWQGGLPTAVPDPSSTVWGVVYDVPKDNIDAIEAIEAQEKRIRTEVETMDRMGQRHHVVTFLCLEDGNDAAPSAAYLELMLAGSQHWDLPIGWIMGLKQALASVT
jgi:AIG2-like family